MQTAIGSDIMMVLDVCLDSTTDVVALRDAMERTHRWALRSLAARSEPGAGAVRDRAGGREPGAAAGVGRASSPSTPSTASRSAASSVGDTRAEREDITHFAAELLPADRPRYLMGVGTPPDLLHAIAAGVDMFDCVLPTHLAWQGTAFTSTGRVRVTRGPARARRRPARRRVRLLDLRGRSAARTCITSSSAASRSVRGSSRSTTFTTITR